MDSNDIEGLLLLTKSNVNHVFKANYPIYYPNPPEVLGGPPIGFLIEFGHTAVDLLNTPNQMMQLQTIYNACVCPSSYFLGNAPPPDLSTVATVGQSQKHAIPFQ